VKLLFSSPGQGTKGKRLVESIVLEKGHNRHKRNIRMRGNNEEINKKKECMRRRKEWRRGC